ncbi:MAG: hypothetical protein ACJ8F3_16780 [Xanthobacteraceae bacterium]
MLDKVGDADGFECSQHGRFKVAATVFEDIRCKNASAKQWEAALQRAKERTAPDKWPTIMTYDLLGT